MPAARQHTTVAFFSIAVLLALALAGAAGSVEFSRGTDREAPTAPANVRVTAAAPSAVSLAWNRSRDNVDVAFYDVYLNGKRSRTGGTAYEATNLRCGASIAVRVVARDHSLNGSAAAETTVSTAACPDARAPSRPSGFRQAATTQDSVILAWAPSADDTGVVSYGVYRDQLLVQSGSEPTTTITDLACGSTVEVQTDAVDAAGNRSERRSAWVQTAACASASAASAAAPSLRAAAPTLDASAPSQPSELTFGAVTESELSLSWSASADDVGVVGYDVFRNGSKVASVSATSYTQGGLVCDSSYWFGVEALDAAGNRSSRVRVNAATAPCAAGDDKTPPTRPANLAVRGTTPTSVALAWSPSSDDVGVVGYDAHVNGKKIVFVSATSVTLPGLLCGTSYWFGVAARDASGNRSERSRVPATTAPCSSPPPTVPPPPEAPSTPPTTPETDASAPTQPANLAVSGVTRTSVALTWSASSDDVGVAGYRVYVNNVGVANPTQPGATVSALACGTAFTFEVDAVDAADNRSTRARVTASTSPCADTQAPTAPTDVVASSRTATSIALTWTASTDNLAVTSYGLYRGGSSVGSSATTTGIYSGLTCNTNYTLSVDATDAAGNRSGKATVLVSTTACPDTTPPAAPTGLAASSVTQASLTLTWNAASDNVGVVGYDVFRNGTKMATATATSSNQGGLTCGTSYFFGVEALDAAGNRSARVSVNATTSVCAPPPPPPPSWLAPYPASSIWRTPIPANPAIDANNTNRISYWLANSVRNPHVTLHDWAVAVAVAQPDSPRYTIRSTTGWANTINALGPVPIPYGTKADPSADGHLAIYDPATNREYGMWQASYDAATDTWSAGGGQAGSTTTNGIAPAGTAGADAANFPLLGGLLRPEEIEAGAIEHALVFAIPGASTGYVKPATHGTGASFNATALQAGNHLQLDPSINVDALAISPWEKTIARALQKYGMYLRDGSGAFVIYAENPINRGQTPNKWAQLGFPGLYDMWFSSAFPWSRMRILQPPS